MYGSGCCFYVFLDDFGEGEAEVGVVAAEVVEGGDEGAFMFL